MDEYLKNGSGNGIQPEHPFKESFNIRPRNQLHNRVVITTQQRGIHLNTLVSAREILVSIKIAAPGPILSLLLLKPFESDFRSGDSFTDLI
ncbi:MAG: toxin-antitoxin system HicB family antitoxin [Acaryochloris sp. CRU_2_0]|nr:toxin-antitoxin system HicB family antitoxin [Acaryochloris sp. CRU_2_0]